jgi:hypothetical protein
MSVDRALGTGRGGEKGVVVLRSESPIARERENISEQSRPPLLWSSFHTKNDDA